MGVYGYNLSNLNERMVLPMENTMENKFSNPQIQFHILFQLQEPVLTHLGGPPAY